MGNPKCCWKPGQIKIQLLAQFCSSVTGGCALDASAVLTEDTVALMQMLAGTGEVVSALAETVNNGSTMGKLNDDLVWGHWRSRSWGWHDRLPKPQPHGYYREENGSTSSYQAFNCGGQWSISSQLPETLGKQEGSRSRV